MSPSPLLLASLAALSIRHQLDWIRIATEIELNYAQFDAFVVLHGTDTMSYTSSALSFMLEDLGKTVVSVSLFLWDSFNNVSVTLLQVITGAQIPLSQLRNDAVENLMGALTIAGHLIIPGTLPSTFLPRSLNPDILPQSARYTSITPCIEATASRKYHPTT